MQNDEQIWHSWAQTLHRWGLTDWAASFLEAAGPLTLIGAQLIYIGQPLLNQAIDRERLTSLANMLENSDQTRAFASYLREAPGVEHP